MHKQGDAIKDLVYDDVDAVVSCDANLGGDERTDVEGKPCCGAHRD